MVWQKIAGWLAGDTAKAVGKGVGSVMNRMGFVEKMSESQRADKMKELLTLEFKGDELQIADVNKAREMAIVQMQTQKASWLVRQMNGALRPFAGWLALLYVTDKFWGPVLDSMFTAYTYTPIPRDAMVDGVMAGILAFFFGFRHLAKTSHTNMKA